MEVLKNRQQIKNARTELASRNLSFLEPAWRASLKRLRLLGGVSLGDWVKSWDVLLTAKFIESRVEKSDPILDLGCFASELIVILHHLGYTRLAGADLNPDVGLMPYHESIDYQRVDFMHTSFADASFQAITAISVIEHGFQATPLLKEVSRLLRPGGYFVASFDYWPEKIDTTGIRLFDVSWHIFSGAEVAQFVSDAKGFGLESVGDLKSEIGERAIEFGGKKYTFGWIVLRKAP
jgi:SAM-dependent methyltransferase